MEIKKVLTCFLFISLVFMINLISAEVLMGNQSGNISFGSGRAQQITGWINVSLNNEPDNTLLMGPEANMTLKDFLDANKVSYSCFPYNCDVGYYPAGSEYSSRTINIPFGISKVLGIRLIGNVTGVSDISFNITSNAQDSCYIPLKIDVLGDDIIEWRSEAASSNNYCTIMNKPYGCFEKSAQKFQTQINTEAKYCEKITVPAVKAFTIGASVIGNGSAKFILSLVINGGEEVCKINDDENIIMNASGEVICTYTLDQILNNYTEIDVCIRGGDGYGNNIYNITYQPLRNGSCGYMESNGNTYPQDFEIFAKPLKYAALTKFRLDKYNIDTDITEAEQKMSDLKTQIMAYITNKYNGNCNPQCLIPIKFHSGITQDMTLYDVRLNYTNELGQIKSSSSIYEINSTRPVINMSYKILDISKANFYTPSSYGVLDIKVKLGDKEFGNATLNIKQGPEILAIMPTDNVPALIPTSFITVLTENSSIANNNLTYTWTFGNGTSQVTTTNVITYTFSEVGQNTLTVKVENPYGAESIKTVRVNIVAPKEAINRTIRQYKELLTNISAQINALPPWIKAQKIEKEGLINVDDLRSQISSAEELYSQAFTNEEYVKSMNKLLAMKIPKNLVISQSVNSPFIQSETQIDYVALSSLVGETDEQYRDSYFNAINNWAKDNLETNLEAKTYTLHYLSGEKEDLFSYIKLSMESKTIIDEFYLIINEQPGKVKFNGDVNERDVGETAISITFSEFDGQKDIELLYPKRVDILDMPIVILPPLKNLVVEKSLGPCNHDGTCGTGETWKNCRDDCKPWGWTLTLLIILIIFGAMVYIGLQEWYKRYYEANLFLSRNQLFNLINYINNANNQGLSKKEIFDKLLILGWNKEQLEYAWNKYKGLRTGMWEIPVFKWVENKQVKTELEKRKSAPIGKPNPNNTTNKPGTSFKK
ncbi:MAG: PKD domain-containing protein [Candidatus Pacearchaeota archaeon]